MKEKFTITVDDEGLVITGEGGNRMQFMAVEALMLLDILRDEEEKLKRMVRDASPVSLGIQP
jgi:hypothetical protein